MTSYRYAVKVRRGPGRTMPGLWWGWECEGCTKASLVGHTRSYYTQRDAQTHAARCEDLHRANWDAACPSCKAYGRVARACPVCLGRGWVE